jgi:hypothetical protein
LKKGIQVMYINLPQGCAHIYIFVTIRVKDN